MENMDAPRPTGTAFMTTAEAGSSFLNQTMSVTPRQPRSLTTLNRILSATRSIGLRDGEAAVTLKAIADEANVGVKAIYRYFSSPGDIIRLTIRMDIHEKFKRMQRQIGRTVYADVDQIATELSAHIVHRFLDEGVAPRKLKQRLLEHYTTIAYGEINGIAEAIVEAMRRCHLGGDGAASVTEIAMALAGVAGSARIAFLHHPESFDDGSFQRVANAQILVGLVAAQRSTSACPSTRSGSVSKESEH